MERSYVFELWESRVKSRFQTHNFRQFKASHQSQSNASSFGMSLDEIVKALANNDKC